MANPASASLPSARENGRSVHYRTPCAAATAQTGQKRCHRTDADDGCPPPVPPRISAPAPTTDCHRTTTSREESGDRKSTRLNSSHVKISYAVFCLKKKKKNKN